MKTPENNTGQLFPFPFTFNWLDENTTELFPVCLSQNVSHKNDDETDYVASAEAEISSDQGTPQTASSLENISLQPSSDCSIIPESSNPVRDRPAQKKAAKAAKKLKLETEKEQNTIKYALSE